MVWPFSTMMLKMFGYIIRSGLLMAARQSSVGVAGELAGLAAIDVIDRAAVEQKHHRVDHAARIEVAKAPLAVGAH